MLYRPHLQASSVKNSIRTNCRIAELWTAIDIHVCNDRKRFNLIHVIDSDDMIMIDKIIYAIEEHETMNIVIQELIESVSSKLLNVVLAFEFLTNLVCVTSLYARNFLFQARNMFNKLISSFIASRVMTTSSSRAWRLLLASYDSQSSMIKTLHFFFRIHFRTWEEIRAKRFEQNAKQLIETCDILESQTRSNKFIIK
jgi:hypothetical protein